MSEQTFTDGNFQSSVIEASKNKPVLVDFFATWCGPCQAMAPTIGEIANELGDQAIIGKIDVDDNPDSAQNYGVMGIPALKIFRNGEVVEEFTGIQGKEVLMTAMNKHL